MEFINSMFDLLNDYGMSYIEGAGATIVISIVSTFIGCIIGFIVGIIQTIPVQKSDNATKRGFLKLINALLYGYVELFRGTPMIVQSVFIYYGSLQVFSLQMNMWTAGFFIVSINTGAYMAETVRGGIISIDKGQTEAAKAIGMTHFQTMYHIIFPQTLRNIIPQIGNNLIINIKDTAVLSVISISDLFFVHKSVVGSTYRYFESATIVMIMYLFMTVITSRLLRWWESKIDGQEGYDMATTDTLAYTSGMLRFPERKDENNG